MQKPLFKPYIWTLYLSFLVFIKKILGVFTLWQVESIIQNIYIFLNAISLNNLLFYYIAEHVLYFFTFSQFFWDLLENMIYAADHPPHFKLQQTMSSCRKKYNFKKKKSQDVLQYLLLKKHKTTFIYLCIYIYKKKEYTII